MNYRSVLSVSISLTALPLFSAAQDLRRVEDSLRVNLINLYSKHEAYDQAIGLIKEKKVLTKPEIFSLYELLRKKQQTRWLLDSIKLALALQYKRNRQWNQAETIFASLYESNYSTIRNRSILEMDSLLSKKDPPWFEEYPFNPVSKVVKPILPYVGLAVIFAVIMFFVNLGKNANRLVVICDEETIARTFRSAIKVIKSRMKTNQLREKANSSIVPPGPRQSLPYLEGEMTPHFKQLVTAVVPSSTIPIINFLWTIGDNPYYTLFVIVQKIGADMRVNVQLKRKEVILAEWDKTESANRLFDAQLDIAYQALVNVQSV